MHLEPEYMDVMKPSLATACVRTICVEMKKAAKNIPMDEALVCASVLVT